MVECQDSMTALSSADPGRPIDGETPSRWHACRNVPAALAALIGMQDDARHLAAAHCHGHCQRGAGQLRVLVIRQGEAEYPAGGHVHYQG